MKIVAHNLCRHFVDADRNLKVIDQLNVELLPGQSYALIGRSGIGKSTLLHLLAGLERPSSGQVFYDHVEMSALSNDDLADFRLRRIGMVYQFHHLLPEFSALENVALPLLLAQVPEPEAQQRAQALLQRVGLGGRLRHFPGQLSGGEHQRVALARALVSQPAVLFADEPTGSLDVATGHEVCDLLTALVKETGTTLVVATHSQELADRVDNVFEMQVGGSLQRVK
jgi:lipoprotein-releasing system ATP-binding protein